MDETDFANYFDKSKEELKFLLTETQVRLQDYQEVIRLDPSDQVAVKGLQHETERYRAIKLALVACDDNSFLSTINFEEFGTLDVNKVFGKVRQRFTFHFDRSKP